MSVVYTLVVLAVIYVIVCCCDIESFTSKSPICNKKDFRCYKVVGKYDDKDEASNILAYLNKFGITLMRHLRNKYIFNNDIEFSKKNYNKIELTKFLLSNYNPDNIIENAPNSNVNTSYVDDKGKVFALCLREKQSGKNNFHKMEELEFVVLHEMSHMATFSVGHDTEFWRNFKFLLQEAEAAGVHTPVNYKHNPMVYCSLNVDYSPYFDNELSNLN